MSSFTNGSPTAWLSFEFSSDVSLSSSAIVVSSISVGFEVDVIVIFGITGIISQFLPLNPVGHSHLNSPSSSVKDAHFPPLEHVFGFCSQ